ATGISLLTGPLGQKRVEFLQEFMPKASAISMLVNPVSPDAVPEIRDVQAVAHASNLAIRIINASTAAQIETAFVALATWKPDRPLVRSDPLFALSRDQIARLAPTLGVATIFPSREFAVSGGLMSYGTSFAGAYREAGVYVSRILHGANPSDLPVVQPTRFELVINLKTAKALGLEIPPTLLAPADEAIE